VISLKTACEVVSLFRDGRVHPFRFRYYSVESVDYRIVDVEKVNFIRENDRNGLVERTYNVTGRVKRQRKEYDLYQDPRTKSWYLIT
jgi:hypothetical protein